MMRSARGKVATSHIDFLHANTAGLSGSMMRSAVRCPTAPPGRALDRGTGPDGWPSWRSCRAHVLRHFRVQQLPCDSGSKTGAVAGSRAVEIVPGGDDLAQRRRRWCRWWGGAIQQASRSLPPMRSARIGAAIRRGQDDAELLISSSSNTSAVSRVGIEMGRVAPSSKYALKLRRGISAARSRSICRPGMAARAPHVEMRTRTSARYPSRRNVLQRQRQVDKRVTEIAFGDGVFGQRITERKWLNCRHWDASKSLWCRHIH